MYASQKRRTSFWYELDHKKNAKRLPANVSVNHLYISNLPRNTYQNIGNC